MHGLRVEAFITLSLIFNSILVFLCSCFKTASSFRISCMSCPSLANSAFLDNNGVTLALKLERVIFSCSANLITSAEFLSFNDWRASLWPNPE